jgi:ribosomal protein L29
VGFQAGLNVSSGSNNIEIGNEGAAADNKVIKIGTEGTQKKTYIAGIYSNTAVSGLAVVIGSNGELGTVSSSERFKTGIAPMGSNTEKLQQLRPVTFHYKADAQGTLRYGLIAEEVAKVYPELVVLDRNGRIDGIRYDELAPMLLNEMQKEHATVADQAAEIRDLRRQVAKVNDLERELAEMHAALTALRSTRDQLVAQR